MPAGRDRPGGRPATLEDDVANQVQDLTPEEVSKGVAEGRYLLVDVREPNEVEAEAYPYGVVVPLSTFDPKAIPDDQAARRTLAALLEQKAQAAFARGELLTATLHASDLLMLYPNERAYLGNTGGLIATQHQRPYARVHEETHSRDLSFL